nr:MAG TPA: hypothetical protein [Caudoviricetes sp.]
MNKPDFPTTGRPGVLIYAIQVGSGLPLIPTILALELFIWFR